MKRPTRRWLLVAIPAALLVPAAIAVGASLAAQPEQAVQAKTIRIGTDAAGRKWQLGGFSGLYPVDGGKRFLTVTDRGPNGDVTCNGVDGKEIFVPAYAPRIVSLVPKDGVLRVERVVPLSVGTQLASGLSNLPADENSFGSHCAVLPPDPFGVDTEGIAVDPRESLRGGRGWDDDRRDGTLWLADEYRPSVLRVSTDGEMLARIVPGGSPGADYAGAVAAAEAESGNGLDVVQQFPEIVGLKFRKNRGFEDVAIGTFRGRTYIYTALQSPMENPNKDTRKSLALRVFRLDVTDARRPVVDREWVYLLEVKPGKKEPLADKVSAVWYVGPDKLLVEERDDTASNVAGAVTKIWTTDFSAATNLLGGPYDQVATTPTLEQAYLPTVNGTVPADPAGVTPGAKSTCADVNALLQAAGFVNVKLEGMAVLRSKGETTLAVVNDNDFDLAHVLDGSQPELKSQLDLLPLTGCS